MNARILPTSSPTPILTQKAFWVDSSRSVNMEREPTEVWTLYRREEKDAPTVPMHLVHHRTAFLEDPIHDYAWANGRLRVFGRNEHGNGVWIVCLFDDTPVGYVLSVWAKDAKGKGFEMAMKAPLAALGDATETMMAIVKKKLANKSVDMIDGESKIRRLGAGWQNDTRPYGKHRDCQAATTQLRRMLHATFPMAKDSAAFDWNGKKVGVEWEDVVEVEVVPAVAPICDEPSICVC